MSERDELAREVIAGSVKTALDGRFVYLDAPTGGRIADAILAAGYRKPQQVTTVEELRILPSDTVILSDEGCVFQLVFGLWKEIGFRDSMRADDIALPVTVLHVGGVE